MLILQLPLIHIVLYTILNIIKINDEETFNIIFLYITPLIVLPILIGNMWIQISLRFFNKHINTILGVWGLNIMLRMFADAASDYKLRVCLAKIIIS